MAIDSEKIRSLTDQIADIAKRNQAKVPTSKQAVVVSLDGDTTWVEFADAHEQTPVERSTVRCQVGDVVTVQIVDGAAIITGNLSEKSVGASAVSAAVAPVSNEITVVKKLIADSATIADLEATKARIGTLEVEKASVSDLDAAEARIGVLESTSATVENLKATNAKIESLEATKADVTDLNATNAKVSDLEATRAKVSDLEATNAKVTNLEATKASVTDLEAASARITALDAAKANIDLANVNNAWIANGTIKDASISDAQILGVSANKLTAGTIDASKINVTNLNADNLTVGTINGKLIGNESIDLGKLSEEVPTKAQLDKAKEELQGQIDGNIETFTVSVVPTLNNEPAKAWADSATRKKHIGDVAYVVNKSSQQDGYAYRFGYDESSKAYGWVLIKDNDVTAALKRIADAEGNIDGLKSFETSTSQWIDQTDEGLTTIRNRTTTLETQMGDKVNSTTFKELADTVDEQSTTITTMSDTLSKKADGSTVSNLSQTVSQVKQTADGNSTKLSNLSKTVGTKADSSTVTTVSNKVNSLQTTVDGTVESIGNLTTTVSKKADSSTVSTLTETVNSVKKTAEGNSSTISKLQETVDTKADGQTVTELTQTVNNVKETADENTRTITQTNSDLAKTNNKVTEVSQSLDGFKTTVSDTYETKTAASQTKSSLETSIKQTNDAIALKADKTDLDAATKRLTTAETSIKANADQIQLRATKTEVPGLVDVGGRNLMRNSASFPSGGVLSSVGSATAVNDRVIILTTNYSYSQPAIEAWSRVTCEGTWVTTDALSKGVVARSTVALKVTNTTTSKPCYVVGIAKTKPTTNNVLVQSVLWTEQDLSSIGRHVVGGMNTSGSTWRYAQISLSSMFDGINSIANGDKISMSVDVLMNENATLSLGIADDTSLNKAVGQTRCSEAVVPNKLCRVSAVGKKIADATGDNTRANVFYIGGISATAGMLLTLPKIEAGNVPTAWTPAPEDVEAEIAKNSTTIEQNAEAIKLSATKKELSDTQTATLKLAADSIKGYVSAAGGSSSYVQNGNGFTWTANNPQASTTNLLSDSEFSKVGTLWLTNIGMRSLTHHSPISSKKPDGTEFQSKHAIHAKFTGTSGQRFYHAPAATAGGFNHVVGKTYTMTFWARAEAQCTFSYGYNGKSITSKTLPASKDWVYYSVTYTADSTPVPSWYCNQAVEIYMTEPMLVEGSVPATWQPMPSETKDSIANAATTATGFMDYNETESGALTLGYRSNSTISTVRAVLTNAALSFKDTANTVLGSFGASSAQVGADSAKNALVNANGVFLRNGTTNLASFQGEQAQIGLSTAKNLLMTKTGLYLRSGVSNLLTIVADRIEMLGGKLMFGAKNLSERTINGMYSTDTIALMSEKTENSGKAGVVEVGEGHASMNIDGTDYGMGIVTNDAGKRNGNVNVDNLYFGGMQLNADQPKHGFVQVTAEGGADAMWAARGGTATTWNGDSDYHHCLKFGVGSGGINRGIYDDAFNKWVIYWNNDTSKHPIIPGLYMADYSASSLKPNYSGYVTKELASGSTTSGTLSYSLSGYGALGIIGVDVSGSTYPAHTLVNAWVTDRKNGSANIHYTIKNTTSSSKNTCKVRFHVLVAKQ